MQKYSWPLMKNTIGFSEKLNLIKHILFSDNFTQGKKVEEFEEAWSQWLGAKHSLYVTSGSTANFLLVAAIMEKYKLKKGDKVLLPACTWVTNINPIIQLGLKPIFCDINLVDYSFDTEDLVHIAKKHPDIKMIFVTHLLGIPAKNNTYQGIFPDALIIDDVCESHGCRDTAGYKVGKNSLGATFSFYFGHHMSTIEGGMISTNDTELYDLMRMKRSHGLARNSLHFDEYAVKSPEIEKSFLFVTDGYNFRNTELGAILGLSQLKKLDKFVEIRKNNHSNFVAAMNFTTNNFYPAFEINGNSSFCFPLIARTKEVKQILIEKLKSNGIEYRPVVGGNLLRQPYLKGYKVETQKKFLNADILHENGIYIGNNQFVNQKDIKKLQNILLEINDEIKS
jgi:CDP-6-deoxy-D-xylo-4-hexulose-3-dehydrase